MADDYGYKSAFSDMERVGHGNILGTKTGDEKMDKFARISMTPDERFNLYVDAISRKLRESSNDRPTDDDIIAMLDMSPRLKNVAHVNPTAYILGYMASGGGGYIAKNKAYIKNMLAELDDISRLTETEIEPPDVIRYARLWERLM